jgi:hypothetical protein
VVPIDPLDPDVSPEPADPDDVPPPDPLAADWSDPCVLAADVVPSLAPEPELPFETESELYVGDA